jgi:prolyl oligopeptidase
LPIIQVTREFATSKDGSKIPLNIVFRKEMKRDGQNPTLLYGYGGYGMSMSPNFEFTRPALVRSRRGLCGAEHSWWW